MVKIDHDVNMAKYTTLGVGGKAKYLARAGIKDDLLELLMWADSKKLPVVILGSGSNVLVSDAGFPGLVIVNRVIGHKVINGSVIADSGASLSKLALSTVEAGLSGLEWASGIPGTIGGAIIGNAGALGGQIADVLVEAEVYHDGGTEVWHNADFEFGYRNSRLKGKETGVFILTATFKLSSETVNASSMIAKDQIRRGKNFLGKTAGSYFKNPEGFAAGELIERAGLKGYRIGGAIVSIKHANVFANIGQATATDFIKLEKHVAKVVYDKFGVTLTPEVVKIGKF